MLARLGVYGPRSDFLTDMANLAKVVGFVIQLTVAARE